MRGHLALIALRHAGHRPRSVYLTDADDAYAHATAASWHMHPHCHTGEAVAHIRIERGDFPEELDLSFLAGLEVHVATERGHRRFLQICQAAQSAGASVVAGLSEGQVHIFKTATEIKEPQ